MITEVKNSDYIYNIFSKGFTIQNKLFKTIFKFKK